MDDVKIAGLVGQLTKSLNVADCNDSVIADLSSKLERSILTPRSSDLQLSNFYQNAKQRSKDTNQFMSTYEELKVLSPVFLKSALCLMGKLAEDQKTCQSLEQSQGSLDSTVGESKVLPCNGSHSRLVSSSWSKVSISAAKNLTRTIGPLDSVSVLYGRRTYLSLGFIMPHAQPEFVNIASATTTAQEDLMIESMLFVLQGIESTHIYLQPSEDGPLSFSINPSVESAIRDICQRILPVAVDYHSIVTFIERNSGFKYGQVSHALCGALKSLIYDYYQLLYSFEREHRLGQINLQKLWFYVQPLLHSMNVLSSICRYIAKNNLNGGSILCLLHGKAKDYIGDRKAQDLCVFLLKSSSKPFFCMLERWLYTGTICDQYNEFMVCERQNTLPAGRKLSVADDCGAWFKDHYFLRKEHTPEFLYTVSEQILDTGKFLNIIQLCGDKVYVSNRSETLCYDAEGNAYLDVILKAYDAASSSLVETVMSKFDLLGHLRSLKHYFLIDQGDFLLQFLEASEKDLSRPVNDIIPDRLKLLLELALSNSTASTDPHKNNLRLKFEKKSLTTFLLRVIRGQSAEQLGFQFGHDQEDAELTGVEAFCFDYKFQWPLSLMFSLKIMCHYEMIFRRLFFCKYVERQLCKLWLQQRSFACSVRQRMLTFVQNYLYYATIEIIETNFSKLVEKIKEVKNINDVTKAIDVFLDTCSEDCLLTSAEYVRTVDNLLRICLKLTDKANKAACEVIEKEFDDLLEEFLSSLQSSTSDHRSCITIAQRLDVRALFCPH